VPSEAAKLISAGFARSTWEKHSSALSSLAQFEQATGVLNPWPLSIETILAYIQWATNQKNLLPGTVKSYLSSLATVHKLRLLSAENFDVILVKAALKGAQNIHKMSSDPRPKRVVMTVQLLKILGHEIAASAWGEDSKRVVWTACTVAFFGTLRLGEILHSSETIFDPKTCLMWDCVRFLEGGSILIHLRCPKSDSEEGDFIDIFPFPGCCPVEALTGLAQNKPGHAGNSPVFQFESGKLLTVQKFTNIVRTLLSKHLGPSSSLVSAHSFRAAIPSILAKFPDVVASTDICNWGRWRSSAFQSYTRLKQRQKFTLFKKVVDAINADI
jgi:hypothetical protein